MAEIDPKAFTRAVQPIALANRSYSKIFGIGANKTATTSLEAILRLYGFALPALGEQVMHLSRQTLFGNYEPFKRFVARYDGFQDHPFSRGSVYVAADCLFPNSKFILTERDPEQWFDSVCRYARQQNEVEDLSASSAEEFVRKFKNTGARRELYENLVLAFDGEEPVARWELVFDRAFRIDQYERRNEEIRRYFHGRPDSLLCIDLTREPDTSRICDFLHIPRRFAIRTPHLNKSR